ncbi:hypothetical protein D3C71_1491350 [compost metagenome]
MAETPSARAEPAWEALPWKRMRYLALPLRALMRSPLGRAASATSTQPLCLARSTSQSFDQGEPISSSQLQQTSTLSLASTAGSIPFKAYQVESRPLFMSDTPGPKA